MQRQRLPARLRLTLGLARQLARLEQRRDREQHPRRAEAALERRVARERLLEPREPGSLGQALDRQHLAAVGVRGEKAAGAHRLPVDAARCRRRRPGRRRSASRRSGRARRAASRAAAPAARRRERPSLPLTVRRISIVSTPRISSGGRAAAATRAQYSSTKRSLVLDRLQLAARPRRDRPQPARASTRSTAAARRAPASPRRARPRGRPCRRRGRRGCAAATARRVAERVGDGARPAPSSMIRSAVSSKRRERRRRTARRHG